MDVLSYCLMTNHIHLVAIPEQEDSLSKTLRDTHGLYALYFNRKYDLTGHLWQGRPYSCILDSSHLRTAVRYVERNPVRAKMVERAEDYPWSSAAAHCGLRDDRIVGNFVLPWALASEWSNWLALEETISQLRDIRESTKTGKPYGSEEFIGQLEVILGRSLRPQKRGRKPFVRPVSLGKLGNE